MLYLQQCQVHSNNSGWLMSPNYPENYPNDVSYCWIIKSTIQLEFSLNQFNTEEDYDWLRVRSNNICISVLGICNKVNL